MANLGFVGLGIMGRNIVERLMAAGHSVAGYNRTRSKAQPLVAAGMRWCDSPRQVAEASEITFSMVMDSTALGAVTQGPDGILAGLAPGKLYVDMSTVSPRLVSQLAEQAAVKGAQALEALSNSVVASPLIKYRGPFILKMPEEVWFSAAMMQKDLLLAQELGRELGVPLPTAAIANELLSAARGMGYADQDFAVLFK